jgi:predicted deacylase
LLLMSLATDLFPADYASSRARFRATCAERLAGPDDFCRAFSIPSAKNLDLTVEAAGLGRGGKNLLILQSGTHGVEGYAGAAIQELAMRRHLDAFLANGIDVLLIHAFDPFGFAKNRRVDESNVNLNRAFPLDPAGYAAVNSGYRALRQAFEPDRPVRNAWLEYLRTDRRLLWQFARVGFDRRPISEAMNQGQHEFADGINYGGLAPTAQTAIVRELLAERLKNYANVMFIDWHTGLGDRGTLHWMATETSTPALLERLRPTFEAMRPARVIATSGADTKGFYRVTGSVDRFVASLVPAGANVLAATAEFGTMGAGLIAQIRTAHRLIVENQAAVHGTSSPAVAARIRRDFVALFTPDDPKWRASVLEQADLVLGAIARDFGAR